MDRTAAQRILRLFDQAYPLLCAHHELPRSLRRQIADTTNLRLFEKGLGKFLTDYHLSKDILDDRWTKFLHSYAGVIEDCPLLVRGDNLQNI